MSAYRFQSRVTVDSIKSLVLAKGARRVVEKNLGQRKEAVVNIEGQTEITM